jgi:lysophospholipase L1-like esterase
MSVHPVRPHRKRGAAAAAWITGGGLLLLTACGSGSTSSDSTRTESSAGPSSAQVSEPADLSVVVIGDSLPYARQDCGGCTGFPDLYGSLIEESTGRTVDVANLSTHDGVNTPGLLARIRADLPMREAVTGADVVVVSSGFNDAPWSLDDDACDGANGDDIDWSRYSQACIDTAAATFAASFDGVLAEIEGLRDGAPTAVRVINGYNSWNGWSQAPPEATAPSILVQDAFGAITCEVAAARGALCADTYSAFNGADGSRPSGDLLAGDYTHPSAEGHEVIADVVFALGLEPLVP